jgi:hypothetical protein
MAGYRIYFLDLRHGHIKNFRQFVAEHDAAAMVTAERLREEGPMELWCRTRKVEEWPALFAPRPKASA